MIKLLYFKTVQFSISHMFALSLNVKQFYLTHRLVPVRCYHIGPGSDDNEGVLYIPQSSRIIGASPSDCLVSYIWIFFGWGSYLSTEMQLVYSTGPGNWVEIWDVFQKYQDCSCIYKDTMKNEWCIHFKIVSWHSVHLFQWDFHWNSSFEIILSCAVVSFFNVVHISKSLTFEMKFQFRKQKAAHMPDAYEEYWTSTIIFCQKLIDKLNRVYWCIVMVNLPTITCLAIYDAYYQTASLSKKTILL